MDHSEARELLETPLATLGGERGAALREHLAGCAECRDWQSDLRFLAQALKGPVNDHLSSEEIARRAVDPEDLTPFERARVDEHLEACRECHQELTLATGALTRARGGRGRLSALAASAASAANAVGAHALPLRWALAVGLIAAVALGFLFQGSPATDAAGVRSLSGGSLRGTQIIDAPRSIMATSVTIDRGSNVALRAGESVAFGDGFSVGSDASFSVEITGSARAPRGANGS